MMCSDCGSQVADTATFCTQCGARVLIQRSIETQPGGANCASCGAAIVVDASFCTACGSATNAAPDADATRPRVNVADTMLRSSAAVPEAIPVAAPPMFMPGRRQKRRRKVMPSILIGLGVFVLVVAAFIGGYFLFEFIADSSKAR